MTKLGGACRTTGSNLWRHVLCDTVYKNWFKKIHQSSIISLESFFYCNKSCISNVLKIVYFMTGEQKKSINRALELLMQYTRHQLFHYFMKCSFSKLFHNQFLQCFWHHIFLKLTELKCYLLLKSKCLFLDFHPWIRWNLLCMEEKQITI